MPSRWMKTVISRKKWPMEFAPPIYQSFASTPSKSPDGVRLRGLLAEIISFNSRIRSRVINDLTTSVSFLISSHMDYIAKPPPLIPNHLCK